MEKLQNDIKKYCDKNDDNLITLTGRMETGVLHKLPHHEMMIPHWQKLFKALNGRASTKGLHITGQRPIPVLDIMFPALHLINLEVLSLVSIGLRNDGYMKLSSFVKDSRSLKYLIIGGERIRHLSIVNSLSDAVMDHPSLDNIALFKCGLSNDACILQTILAGCKTINVGIVREEFGSEAVGVILDFIRSNNPTKILRLDNNNISDNDTLLLASALKKNSNLQQLNLRNNKITEEGVKTLLNAMFDPTSMDSLVELNHTCMTYTYDTKKPSVVAQRPPIETEVLDINADDNINIQQKIRKKVVLLCGVDGSLFDLSHLNDLPLKLMPRVLELIQEHTATREKEVVSMPNQLEKDALSRIFHTLRGWELPLFFENLSPDKGAARKRKRKSTRH